MRQMQWKLVIAGLVLLSAVPVQAKPRTAKPKLIVVGGTPLAAADKQHLLNDNFAIVKTVAAIPKSVQNLILGTGGRDSMADAGQPFQMTDVINDNDKPLPGQRLIFAGTSAGYSFVYSEHGGYAYWTDVSLYRLLNGRASLVWRGRPKNRINILSLSQMRGAINTNKLDDDYL